MRSRSNRRSSNVLSKEASVYLNPQQLILYEGGSLVCLLKSIQRVIKSARILDGALPDKIWLKQQFSIGVNDVTRVLERMPPMPGAGSSPPHNATSCSSDTKVSPVKLQHLPSLASSRKVPLIFVKDKNGGSLRLGELVKLKTAIAIGVKDKGNAINLCVDKILSENQPLGAMES